MICCQSAPQFIPAPLSLLCGGTGLTEVDIRHIILRSSQQAIYAHCQLRHISRGKSAPVREKFNLLSYLDYGDHLLTPTPSASLVYALLCGAVCLLQCWYSATVVLSARSIHAARVLPYQAIHSRIHLLTLGVCQRHRRGVF